MSLTIAQQKKHLLLLNKLHRNALKAELIPTPSKLSDDKIEKLFNEFFKKKDNYYIPKVSSTILKIDEEEFKKLYKEPKEKKEVKPMKQEEPKPMKIEEPKEEIDKEKIKNEKIIKLKSVIDSVRGRHLTGHYGLMKSYDEAYEYLTIDEKKKFFSIIKSLYELFKENLLNNLNLRDNYGDYLSKYKNYVSGLKNKISNLTESIKQKKNLKTKKARENAFPIIEKYEKEIKEAENTIKYLTDKTDERTEEIKKIKEISFNSLDDIRKYQSLESVKKLIF